MVGRRSSDAQVVHQEGAAERHQHEAAGGQQGHREEGQQVARLGDGVEQVHERAVLLRLAQVGVHRLQLRGDHHQPRHAQRRQHDERRMPVPAIRQEQAQRQAQHLAGREGGLDQAHHAAAQGDVEQVGGDRQHHRTDHAAEQAREHARGQQQLEGGREAAPQRAHQEAGVEEHQDLLAVEAVGEAGGDEAGDARAERVGRHDQAELLGRDRQRAA
jgi:hypothetical protein